MQRKEASDKESNADDGKGRLPSINLPKGGGAIRGIGEKFAANPVAGTGSMTVPIATSPGRSGFGPQLSLSYDSGAGNGPFGIGWSLSLPAVVRKTDKGLPQYRDEPRDAVDVFILSGNEDLVPLLKKKNDGSWARDQHGNLIYDEDSRNGYLVRRYRPRIEGLFARIERWTRESDGDTHWRSISKDNILTVYGSTLESRIADPANPSHVFSWLICQSYDDKGNAILYEYVAENDDNVDLSRINERNRVRSANRYLKYIRYGNRQPLLIDPSQPSFRQPHVPVPDFSSAGWMFEVVFDYGEGHYQEMPPDADGRIFATATSPPPVGGKWPARQDPFSTYRSCFEVRSYRLCRRVLMFHLFPDELAVDDYLVRSTEFIYREKPNGTFMSQVLQSGFKRLVLPDQRYLKRSLPPFDFEYTVSPLDDLTYDQFPLQEIDEESLQNLPAGIDGSNYRWVDLDGEGISGVLSEQADAWFYKPNLGNGRFGPVECMSPRPSLAALNSGRQQLLDLAGDGNLDLVAFGAPTPGFFTRTDDAGWDLFRTFRSLPNIDWQDPNLRFVDLTGDGHADIMITEDQAFSTWYESRAEEGFGPSNHVLLQFDEEEGPRLIFADGTQSVYLADMSGDGLSDLVRVRQSEVSYWPNIGYGRFGAKVTMNDVPWFDDTESFDERRVHLADTDGSGPTDIIYLGRDGVRVYLNQHGNSLSEARLLSRVPSTDNLTSISVVDFLGRGTACLLWSSPLPGEARRPLRYLDLMGGVKPHLLKKVSNNLGSETYVEYASSTQFYLADKAAGTPWVTRLPFPVHVVTRVETKDLVSNTRLVSTYRYRHGFFDGVEREFHGFAYVEQRDAESVVGEFDLPPVVTKTWFHNGAFLEEGKLEAYFKDPDNQEFFTGDAQASFLPDIEPPPELTYDEMREAARALKGSILRQEVYADDDTTKAEFPYSVSERSYKLTCLQPQGPNRHAVFFNYPAETIDYHYERNPDDPRISHALTLEVDDYGNVLKSVAIGYQRRVPAFDEQKQTLATLTESQYTNPVLGDDAYRTPLPAEVKTYELTAPKLKGSNPLDFSIIEAIADAAVEIAYEAQPTPGQTEKRLIEQVRTLYRKNDLSALLTTGKLESMALPGESYKMAFTPGLLDIFQSKASRVELVNSLTGPEGRYRNLDSGAPLWIPSGQIFYSQTFGDSAQQEFAFARTHFFLPHRFQDPFGNTTIVTYDGKNNLLLVMTQDAVGNRVMAEQDYRVLQPKMVTDPNGNRSEARFDALGMLAGTAVRGKAVGAVEGDSLDTFTTDLTPAQIKDFFNATDPRALAVTHLGTATTRIVYDLERVPVCAVAIARETHVSDLTPGAQSKTQLHFVYADGFGREAQTRVQAEPGPQDPSDPASPWLDPRWVCTGEKVYNNKGKPVRQYEPFFSPTPQFGIEKWGVSSTLFYDPAERVVATLHPNKTFEKVVFDPWQQTTWDVNDTVAFDPKTDRDVVEFFSRLADSEYLPTWYQQRIDGGKGPDEKAAANKAAKHADTPTVAHFDTLGRIFLTIANNGKDAGGNDQLYRTRTVLDIEGNQRQVIDALDRIVMEYDYNMLGTRIHQSSMEAGERWMLNDVTGKPIRAWNSRKYAFRTEYDALRRPVRSFVQGGDPTEANPKVLAQEILFERTIYGDSADTGLTDLQQRQANLRGKVFRHFDGAGIVTTDMYDFKGNSLQSSRQFATGYKNMPDWSQNPAMESETFSSSTTFDALNRAISVTAPDQSVYRPTFNEANLLEKVDVNLRGATTATSFVTNIDYNAKGQRTLIEYGNGAQTTYEYDKPTFRLVHLKTTRKPPQMGLISSILNALGMGSQDIGSQIFTDAATVQDLRYVYDPAGNITRIADGALQTVFNNNQQIDAACDYTYDPLYRLIAATGREHIGQSAFQFNPSDGNYRDYPFVGAAQLNNLQALRNYTEQYDYDAVGNFMDMVHKAPNGNWTRTYTYNEGSLIEGTKKSNRLSQTALQTTPGAPAEQYLYDAHGNMTRMPHLPLMQWDFKDKLCASSRQVVNEGTSETNFYVYDAGGQRARKVTERQNGTRKNERFYVGGFEVYREYDGSGAKVMLAREALHVMDDKQRIALVETKTINSGSSISAPTPAQRYQLGNHLGSASLELDDVGGLISYEEYLPYGSTVYQAGRSAAEVGLKRYRYMGKERDEETGFTYHGARYYAPWLGRWSSSDPVGTFDGLALYVFVKSNPMILVDPSGRNGEKPSQSGWRWPFWKPKQPQSPETPPTPGHPYRTPAPKPPGEEPPVPPKPQPKPGEPEPYFPPPRPRPTPSPGDPYRTPAPKPPGEEPKPVPPKPQPKPGEPHIYPDRRRRQDPSPFKEPSPTPVHTPGTPVPAPGTPVPAPGTPVPAPETPVPAPETPVPAPGTPVPAPETPVSNPSGLTEEQRRRIVESDKPIQSDLQFLDRLAAVAAAVGAAILFGLRPMPGGSVSPGFQSSPAGVPFYGGRPPDGA